jgi:Predicted membrane protein
MHLARALPLRKSIRSQPFRRILTFLSLSLICLAQTTSSDPRAGYQKAMDQRQANSRILALENWEAQATTDPLRADAFAVLVWSYKQIGNQPKASAWAQKLLDVDSDNSLALAVLADSARYHESSTLDQNMANSLSLARQGLRHFTYLHRPEGMSSPEFLELQNATQAWLNGAAGFAYVHQQDYITARNYLRKAATLQPGNPQYVYELALADLSGKQPDSREGFLYLAKSVNLTQGTPAGQQIAQYAASRYRGAGGSEGDWNKFLVATAVPNAPEAVGPTTPAASASTEVASAKAASPALPETSAPVPRAPSTPAPAPESRESEEALRNATLTPPPLPPTQTAKKPLSHPGAPVSLGILLEASLKNGENKRAVTYALSDLVRHLRENDEAFILSFSHDLVFEQDLTSNYDLLRQAVDSIKPDSGAALLDAVGFASGHLNRISRKGNNRILLVISDGRDISSKESPFDVAGEIDSSGVKIYCIGLGISEAGDRTRLEALSARTGGQASFIGDPGSFRATTHQFALGWGIDFPQ